MSDLPLSGKNTKKCPCGECYVEIKGEPAGCFYCHCNECRKISGQPFILGMPFQEKDLKFHGKTQKANVKDCKMETISCKKCHTFLANSNKFGMFVLPVTTIEGVDASKAAKAHIFYKERVVDCPDKLPKFCDVPKDFGGSDKMDDGSPLPAPETGLAAQPFQCLCGKVKVNPKGVPKGCFICHCNECRMGSKQPLIEGCVYDPADVDIDGNVEETEVVAAKGEKKGLKTVHCKKCNLCIGNYNGFGLLVLPAQRLNGPRHGAQIFWKEKIVGDCGNAAVPKFIDLPKEFGGSGQMVAAAAKGGHGAEAVPAGNAGCNCIVM